MQIPQYAHFVPRAVLLAACLLFACFGLPARAQNTQTQGTVFKAYLQADKEGGNALANAQISADGAGAQVSGSDGLFVLKFTGKKPGEKISLQISKPGWRVLHPIMVDRLLPAKQEVPEKILLCQEAQCDALVLEYFSSKAISGIKREYETLIAKLRGEAKGQTQGQLNAKKEQIAALQKERDELLAKARDAAAQLARVPQGAVSNTYLQAMEQFRGGHIQQALELLKDEEMSAREAKNKQEREEMINSRLLKGKLQVLSGQYDAAQLQFEKAVKIDAQSYAAWFDYAYFLNQQRQITKAISAYENCLPLARAREGQYEVAAVLNNLAGLYEDDNHMPAALAAYEEALKSYRELAAQNRAAYLPYVAMTLNNLGNLHYKENRLPAALAAYEDALKIKRELATQSRAAYLPTVAATLNNLGGLHYKENRLPAALAAFEEALKIRRELAVQNRAAYLPDLAATLNNLGSLHDNENHLPAALAAYDEALKIKRELAAQNRAAYLPTVAATLNNLGILHYKKNRLPAALAAYEEALKSYRELAAQNRAAYLQHVAITLNNLGNLHDKENRLPAALAAYEAALKIRRELAEQNRAAYLPDVAMTLHSLGRFHLRANNPSTALLALEEAQEQWRELAAGNTNAYAPDLADTLTVLGYLHASQQRPPQARMAYEQALAIYRQFLLRNPALFADRIALLEKFLTQLPP